HRLADRHRLLRERPPARRLVRAAARLPALPHRPRLRGRLPRRPLPGSPRHPAQPVAQVDGGRARALGRRHAGRHRPPRPGERRGGVRGARRVLRPCRRTPGQLSESQPALYPTSASHSSSVSTWMPSSAAVFSFEPAPGPATTMSVFLDTDEATLAPRLSACALASSRVSRSSVPVKTTVLPATAVSVFGRSASRMVISPVRLATIPRLWSSAK